MGLSARHAFSGLENVEPMKRFDVVVWTVGRLLAAEMTHTLEPIATGTRIERAYHTADRCNFLQAAAAHGRWSTGR